MVSPYTVAAARTLMACGLSMKESAAMLGVLARDLDLGLWRHLGEPIELGTRRKPVRPPPMF